MTAVGPVCHIPPTTTITNQPAPQPLPSIPAVQPNIGSIVNTLNQMRTILNYITGRQGSNGPAGQNGANNANSKNKNSGRWSEQSRTEETERVYQNNDKTSDNWIDVKRINSLTMRDSVTGEQWRWDRNRS